MSWKFSRPSNALYTASLGTLILRPILNDVKPYIYGPGISLDDCENCSVTPTLEKSKRKSKAFPVPTTVFDRISGKEFAFSVMVMKHIPIVRTASMLGEEGVKNQMAEVGITGSLGDVEPGLHKLPHRGIENVTFSSDGVPLIPGEDYTVDRGIGWFETTEMFPDFTYTYDTVQISNGFISFIGKGSGLRCGIDFIPMNSDGAQGMLELDEVILTAESARSLIAAGSDPEGVQLNGIIVPRDDGSFGIETDRILDN